VEDSRTIHIDQSHWNSGGISRDIEVKDVSENNDWSAVRVQLGRGEAFGSIYPTHGFIYPRADSGVIEEASERAPMPVLDAAPADLRRGSFHRRQAAASVEVAEAPTAAHGLDLSVDGLASAAQKKALSFLKKKKQKTFDCNGLRRLGLGFGCGPGDLPGCVRHRFVGGEFR
jgi:hypothetical protein